MPKIKYTKQDKVDLLKKFLQYIAETDNPSIAEFAYQNDIYDQTLRRFAQDAKAKINDGKGNFFDFAFALKKSAMKQQVFLDKLAIEKGQNPGGPIFLLKALHGYKDGAETPQTINVNIDKVLNAEPEKLESGVQSLLQSTKIDNSRKRKSPSQKN